MPEPRAKILVVDDELIKRAIMEDKLRDAGYDVAAAANPLEAEPLLEKGFFDVVLTDLRMPGLDGISFLRALRERRSDQAVIVMTAYGTVETAVQAMKLGAFDYLQKPFTTEELLLKLDRLQHFQGLSRENKALREALSRHGAETRLIGRSDAMRLVLERIHIVSGTDTNVLITGESGTGKELAARLIHETSHRAAGPFIAVSCAALPRELVEAELFGHEAGAFTGASRRRLGRFELAHGGTLFLDDVDDIPLDMQVKLLRVLQDQAFERLGGERSIHVNVRIISATKNDLSAMVKAGDFREDLFYRLNVVPLNVPPLRDRLDDIPLLTDHFLRQTAVRFNRERLSITPAAISRLQSHLWPGNVRELEHMLERMVVLSANDTLEAADVPELSSAAGSRPLASLSLDRVDSLDMATVLGDIEGRIIRWALQRSGGNLARAAEMLHIPRSTLQYKLSRLGEATSPSP